MAGHSTNPKVSIIIPLYNKIKYIEETLRSVKNCSYSNKEVIVVEDCSTDGSDALAESLCAENDWIFLRHSENRGLSVARNTGLEAASGRYIQFWDADDLLFVDGLGKVVADMEEDGSDFASAIAIRDGSIPAAHRQANKTVRGTTFAAHPECISAPSTCFKLYRKSFLLENDLWFVPGLYMQDLELNLRAAPLARKITMTAHRLGEYRFVDDSWSRTFSDGRVRSAAEIEEKTRLFYRERKLHQFESIRQRKVLAGALNRFFRYTAREYRPVRADGVDTRTSACTVNWEHLELMRRAGANCPLGIRQLVEGVPHRALAWTSLVVGIVPWVPVLLAGFVPCPNFEKLFPKNEILSEELIRACAGKLRGKRLPNDLLF